MKDLVSLRGLVHCRVFERGRLVDEFAEDNLIMTVFRDSLFQALHTGTFGKRPAAVGFGSSATAPTVTDTTLTDGFVKVLGPPGVFAGNTLSISWSLHTHEANGLTIREFGLFGEDDTLLARKVRSAGIEKTSAIALEGAWLLMLV